MHYKETHEGTFLTNQETTCCSVQMNIYSEIKGKWDNKQI